MDSPKDCLLSLPHSLSLSLSVFHLSLSLPLSWDRGWVEQRRHRQRKQGWVWCQSRSSYLKVPGQRGPSVWPSCHRRVRRDLHANKRAGSWFSVTELISHLINKLRFLCSRSICDAACSGAGQYTGVNTIVQAHKLFSLSSRDKKPRAGWGQLISWSTISWPTNWEVEIV